MQHSTELFRKQAIEGQRKNNLGEAMLLPKTNHKILTAVLVSWFLLLCVLLVNASFSSKASVNGWLVSSKPSIDIMAKEPNGIVKSTLISNGQQVSKGQVLLEISRNAAALINETYEQQFNSLLQQRELLNERQLILHQQYQQHEIQSNDLIENYRQHLDVNAQIEEKIAQQLQEATTEEAQLLSLLQNNSIRKITYSQQKEKRQAIALQLARGHATKLEFEQKLLSVQQRQISSKIALQDGLNKLQSNLQIITQEISRFEGASNYLIKSPIDGVVHNLQVSAGETIGSNMPLLQITPLDNPLKAVLYVPSNHAGFIKNKQLVKLKLTAFPYQKFGMSVAEVSHVSQQILLPHQVKRVPIQLTEPVFVIEAALNNQQINANGGALDLKSGMLFQADITLSNRSLLEWLLNPIYSLRGQL